jgi:hypothetical protein
MTVRVRTLVKFVLKAEILWRGAKDNLWGGGRGGRRSVLCQRSLHADEEAGAESSEGSCGSAQIF